MSNTHPVNIDIYYNRKKPYNTAKLPRRQPRLAAGLIELYSKIATPKPYKIEKINMEGLKPPYLLLSNHMYFVDFQLAQMAVYPHRMNSVATIDGYYRRPGAMEWMGCICKRKFTNDMYLLSSIDHVLKKYGDILCMYPEARYSPVGTTAILPDSLGMLIKREGTPVVVLLHHGNYLHTPFWGYRRPRKVPLYTTMKQVLTAGRIKEMQPEEIMAVIRREMTYDEYRWQKEQGLRITEPDRAEGLHKVLYQCPHCLAESRMTSVGTKLTCSACGKTWEMDELGELHAAEGVTEFPHIPDWYEWERAQVRKQIEEGRYSFSDTVDVWSMPRAERFEHVGTAHMTHDPENGFVVEGNYNGRDFRIVRRPLGMYGVHIEYDYCYLRPEDCIDISTENDSLYCYPTLQNVVTKLSLATEEIYRLKTEERKARKTAAKEKTAETVS